jgi:hypothetical protein
MVTQILDMAQEIGIGVLEDLVSNCPFRPLIFGLCVVIRTGERHCPLLLFVQTLFVSAFLVAAECYVNSLVFYFCVLYFEHKRSRLRISKILTFCSCLVCCRGGYTAWPLLASGRSGSSGAAGLWGGSSVSCTVQYSLTAGKLVDKKISLVFLEAPVRRVIDDR